MKFLSRLLLLSLFGWGAVFAQSNLPACQGSDVSSWTNCFGTQSYAKGSSYVGEFKDGMFDGQGTYIYVHGLVDRQGLWEKGKFIGSTPVQQASGASQTSSIVAVQPDNSERDKLLAEVEACLLYTSDAATKRIV